MGLVAEEAWFTQTKEKGLVRDEALWFFRCSPLRPTPTRCLADPVIDGIGIAKAVGNRVDRVLAHGLHPTNLRPELNPCFP